MFFVVVVDRFELREKSTNRFGFSSSIYAVCDDCGMSEFLATATSWHLLARCLPGFTQNANESVNSLVWVRCPKHKWHGRKRIELATASAALHFSAGATAKHEVMAKAILAVGAQTRKESSRRDSGRIKKAEKRIQEQHKKYRVARRQARQRDEEQRRQKEGTTYSAGAFNELTVTTEPARKRKKS